MKRIRGLVACAVLALVALSAPCANGADAEDGFIGVLQSDKSPAEKAAACRSLKQTGTAKSVPALAALLPDKVLAHWARIALETMPCPEAGAALRDALLKAAGVTKAGICDSIGARREAEAVPALAELAKDADEQIASSAAVALGKIGNAAAVDAIKAAKAKAPAGAQLAFCDGLLLAADQLRAAGDKKAAAALCKELYDSEAPEHVRTAAYRGLALVSFNASALIKEALLGKDKAARNAALQLVREIKGGTMDMGEFLPVCTPQVQVALIEALRQRGDPAAAVQIEILLRGARSESQPVRVAAIEALGALGDATIAPALSLAAAKATGAEQDAARECLNQLRDPKTRDALLAALPKAPPAAQAEMVRALGFRKETQAVPALLKMTEGADEATRLVAIKSLGMLATESAAGDLIKLVLQAKTDPERDAAEQALSAACGRGDKPAACAAQVLGAMKDAAVPARIALLRAAGRLGGADALLSLRAGLGDKEESVRDAALRTLADCGGFDAAPDLLKLAKEAQSVPQRVLALRGCWRLVAQTSDRSLDERWKLCEQTFAAAQRPEDRKLGLSELAKLPHAGALKLAQSLCDDEAVRDEAERACVQIAVGLGGSQPAEAKVALQKLAAASKNEALRAEAKKALDGMDQYVGYITTWQAAGPYRQEGKQCAELFDIAFAPEKGEKDVKWQPAPRPADASLFWQADLLPICGGDQCVVYVKTRVFSPKEQKVLLEIGSDDGNKVWVNGKLVHAKNVQRGIKAGDDKADAALKEGWNDFLVKVTQNVMGCAVCMRIRTPDGATVEGLKFE